MYSSILCKRFVSSSIVHDLSRSLNVDMISLFNKNSIRACSGKLFCHNTTVHSGNPLFLHAKSNACTNFSSDRHYCKDYRPFPQMPEFPPVVWPNVFKSLKALLYSYLIIKPQVDPNFSLKEFAKNSKKVKHFFCSLGQKIIIIVLFSLLLQFSGCRSCI